MSSSTPAAPRVRVISTGSEITQGLYADTNAMEISRILRDYGFRVIGHEAAPDDASAIRRAIRASFGGVCDLVIITGGLGPTEDDLNREIIADLWGVGLHRVHRAVAQMRERFAKRGREMPERNLKQADVPDGSTILLNHFGTACCFLLPAGDGRPALLALPGVPREWRAMMDRYFERAVLPLFPSRPLTRLTTLHLAMVPESEINERIRDLFNRDPNLDYTILASSGVIRVRVLAHGATAEECEARLAEAVAAVRPRLPEDALFGEGPDRLTLEEAVVEAFARAGKTLATAESCTGGGLAKRLTDIAGASAVLREGAVTYSNEAKMRALKVSVETLASHGAVSEPCVREMARGIREVSRADVGISVSGIAGPGGGTADKPVGTVWFGIADRDHVAAVHRLMPGDRESVRYWSENVALDLLRRWVTQLAIS
ncbi:MAG: CinA family nicotinamide mononucleotide deamidase-related protein [Sumerlaeia bacterium]